MANILVNFSKLGSVAKATIKADIENVEKELLEELQREIKAKTPVDTGKARAGWQIEGKSIVNRVRYIGYLEIGTIKNRPHRMVARTLTENNINNIISKINIKT